MLNRLICVLVLILGSLLMINCTTPGASTQPTIDPAITNFVILLAAEDGLAIGLKNGDITQAQYAAGLQIVADADKLASAPGLTSQQQNQILMDAITKINNLILNINGHPLKVHKK